LPTVGVLIAKSSGSEQFASGFPEAMRARGYIEGKNVRYEYRADQGEASRLPELGRSSCGSSPTFW
jgi:hypothetical protein